MANMMADHLVLGIFVTMFATMGLKFLPVPVVFYLLGCLVITVQTLVFCLLSVIYITLAIQPEEEH
jgi:F-type H+-transporting ATPase subunit a